MDINVTKIVVMIREGTDQVYVHTDLPSPYIAEVDDEPLQLRFETTKGQGIDYVQAVFGIEPEVLDIQKMVKAVKAAPDEKPYGADVWEEVQSSNLKVIGRKGNDLLIQFKNGATFRYPGKAHYLTELRESVSKGRAFARIKAALMEYERL